MSRWSMMGAIAAVLLAVSLPSAYLVGQYQNLASDTADRVGLQDRQSRLAGSVTRAADLAQAAAVLLSERVEVTPALEADLARMLPADSSAVVEVRSADGRTLLATGPPLDTAVGAEALVGTGVLAGSTVILQLPMPTGRNDSGLGPSSPMTDRSGSGQILAGAFLAAGAGLLLGLGLLWVSMRPMADARVSSQPSADAAIEASTPTAPMTDLPTADRDADEPAVPRAFLEQVLDSIQDAVIVVAPDLQIARVNPAAARLLDYDESDLLGHPLATFLSEDPETLLDDDRHLRPEGRTELTGRGGQLISVAFSAGELDHPDGGHVLVLQNLSDEKRSKKRIQYLTRYDALTRVSNRMQFQHKLQQAMARARRNSVRLALLYVDIDRFKDVNDTFGHPVGDRALEITARRVVDAMDPGTMIGRLAGDEFAVMIDSLPAGEDLQPALAATARMLLDRVAREFYIERRELFVTASIGIAVCPDDADNVVDLIRNADAAMYHAKENGGNTYGFYTPHMNADAVDRLMLKNELRHAMERDEFQVRYQPKVDLRDGHVVGAEALLRWKHPKRGEVPPSVFIPLAEDSSLIFEIGAWVLDQVCSDYAQWQRRLAWPGRVAVNLSLQQLRQGDFVRGVEAIVEKHRLTPSCLELEITESTLMRDGETTLRMLDRLYQLGLHLSIDDFGTGYSSLSALQHFPIGTLKIDKSFVRGAADAGDQATIVTTIINMGRSLRMDVVAEGVETEEQLVFLRGEGCTYAQGHLFGEPVSGEDYLELLVEQQRGTLPLAKLFA